MKTGFLITARLKSSRLPMKLLKHVNNEPIFVWMLRRLKTCRALDEIIVATSTNPQDDPLVELAEQEGLKYFRGSEEDVIHRLVSAANEFKLDYAISMTADCPLLPVEYIEQMIDLYRDTRADLISCYELPQGMYLTGLDLKGAARLLKMKDSNFTEYWLYYYLKTDLFNVVKLPIKKSLMLVITR